MATKIGLVIIYCPTKLDGNRIDFGHHFELETTKINFDHHPKP
jgi:hypothetical protein